jgi:hypothetical protein
MAGERGYYRMYRGWMENGVFSSKAPFSERDAWVWLVEEAAWKDRPWRLGVVILPLKRGQLCHSLRYLGQKWRWSKDKVQRFLRVLENRDMIETASATGGATAERIITICNYSLYQDDRDSDETESETAENPKPRQSRDKTEERKETKDSPSLKRGSPAADTGGVPVQRMVDLWNVMAKEAGLPRCAAVNEGRRKQLHARFTNECKGDFEVWARAVQKVGASSFCRGGGSTGWKAGVDFLLRPSSFLKTIEGLYDDKKPPPGDRGRSNPHGVM